MYFKKPTQARSALQLLLQSAFIAVLGFAIAPAYSQKLSPIAVDSRPVAPLQSVVDCLMRPDVGVSSSREPLGDLVASSGFRSGSSMSSTWFMSKLAERQLSIKREVCERMARGEQQQLRYGGVMSQPRYCILNSEKSAYEVNNKEVMASVVDVCASKLTLDDLMKIPLLREAYAEITAADAKKAADAQVASVKQAAATEERQANEARRLEAQNRFIASVSSPMLCRIDGLSKPTLYLALAAPDEFKLVWDGKKMLGSWHIRNFQVRNAVVLSTPKSSGDSFPDLHTIYEDSIKIAGNEISLQLARRSTFPGSRSAESYEAVCVKDNSITLDQAQRLTDVNTKNNPLRPEILAQQQQQKAVAASASVARPSGDRAALYADGLARQLEKAGHPACSAMASNIRLIGNSGSPEQIRLLQVDRIFDKVPSICLR